MHIISKLILKIIQLKFMDNPTKKIKIFGTFGGDFTPTLLTILGVIMYLRFGCVVGNAGQLGYRKLRPFFTCGL